MYEAPHVLQIRDSDGETICTRCGMINPAEDEPCTVYLSAAYQDEKAA